MLVLGIETATDVCAVGVVDGDRDVAAFALLRPRQHGTRLAGLISAALDASGASVADLSAIAVSAGPGSYTGLRIGVSTAKGLCLASGTALVSVSTLDALAHASVEHAGSRPLVVALPSRRGEVYAAAYTRDVSGWSTLLPPEAVTLDDLPGWVPQAGPLTLAGAGAEAVSGALTDRETRTVPAQPSGLVVARLGRQRLVAGETEDMAAFEPTYLKPFISGGA